MAHNPVVLVHGYSDKGESFLGWKRILENNGIPTKDVHVCTYRTLTNEVTVRDIAEGFERALRVDAKLREDEPFDAIVHSTGMLVVRSWLTQYARRKHRLKRLIGLAPATWGSPLAHKGRSWLGAIFKGNRDLTDPDFMEAGDAVLDALELGSRFTWDLAHADLLAPTPVFGPAADTPYVFIFCGIETYGGLRSVVNEPGMDGTVRWAGCALDTRKIVLDLTRRPGDEGPRLSVLAPPLDSPLVPIAGVNHGTILGAPDKGRALIPLVLRALDVEDANRFAAWRVDAAQATADARRRLRDDLGEWQQFVVHAVDERGDPIPDYHLQMMSADDNPLREVEALGMDVHAYKADPSFRCFHLDTAKLRNVDPAKLRVRVMASSGSTLVAYHGYDSTAGEGHVAPDGKWDAQLDIARAGDGFRVFYPFTTTLVELRLNREPMPVDPDVAASLCRFLEVMTAAAAPAALPEDPDRLVEA